MKEYHRDRIDWNAASEFVQKAIPVADSIIIEKTVLIDDYHVIGGYALSGGFSNYPPKLIYDAIRIPSINVAEPGKVAGLMVEIGEATNLKPEPTYQNENSENLTYLLKPDYRAFVIK